METQPDYSVPSSKFTFEERPAPPIMTILIGLAFMGVYYLTYKNNADWFVQHCFQPAAFFSALNTHEYSKLFDMWLYTNFSSAYIWQLFANLYFFCLFGIAVEKRLGAGRYLLLLLLGSTLSWIAQAWEASYFGKTEVVFISSTLLIFTFLGAYMVLMPEKVRNRTRTRFSSIKEGKNPSEQFGFNPRVFASAFILYAVGSHIATTFLTNGSTDIGGLFSALIAGLIGFNIASFLIHSALSTGQMDPLKLAAVQHYNDLIAIDVSPEDAIKGAARSLKIPVAQVRRWVSQSKDKLKVS